MVIKKKYHFYYAHRNELLKGDKCERLHGHVARFEVYVEAKQKDNGITFLFNDIDKYVKPVVNFLDHFTLVHSKDEQLKQALNNGHLQYIELPFATSAENMAKYLFDQLKDKGLPIIRVDFMETESSTVIYEP